jgi:hypothetical protein
MPFSISSRKWGTVKSETSITCWQYAKLALIALTPSGVICTSRWKGCWKIFLLRTEAVRKEWRYAEASGSS